MEERKHKHENESLSHLRKTVKFHNALLKYGFENFTWEIIHTCNTQEELDYWEKYYIRLYDACDRIKGYNLKFGGKAGGIFTEEARENLGKSTKKKWENPECAKKMKDGLRKGTETVKLRGKLNFIEKICPTCGKTFKIKSWSKNTYCSLQCANANIANREKLKRNSLKAAKIIKDNYHHKQQQRMQLVYEWIN